MTGALALILLAGLVAAASPAAQQPESGREPERLEVRFVGAEAQNGWVEATPLAGAADAEVVLLDHGETAARIKLRGPHPVMVCGGADGAATRCHRVMVGDAEQTLELELAPGSPLRARVVRDRQPIEGAEVSLVPQPFDARREFTVPLQRQRRALQRTATTDENGRFSVTHLGPGTYLAQVVSPGGRIEQTGVFEVAADGERVDLGLIELETGLPVTVQVVQAGGLPIVGARVGAVQGEEVETAVFFRGRTDAEGMVTLSGFTPQGPVTLSCTAHGFLTWREEFEAPPASAVCSLQRLAQVQGQVTDIDGACIAGATVSITGTNTSVTTKEDGRFTLNNLAPGQHLLVAAAPGMRPERRHVEIEAGDELRLDAIELGSAPAVQGLVRDAVTHEPLAAVAIDSLQPPGLVRTTSNADGRFTFVRTEDEPLQLRLSAEGYPVTTREVSSDELDADETWLVELARGGWLQVTVWDSATGGPCTGCEVIVFGAQPQSASLITDASGVALSEPLAPGRYMVGMEEARGFGDYYVRSSGDEMVQATVSSGEVTQVELGRRDTLLTVHLDPAPGGEWLMDALGSGGLQQATPVAPGTFALRWRAGAPLRLRLTSPTATVLLATLAADDRREEISLSLPRTLVTAQLSNGDHPAAGAAVSLVQSTDGTVAASAPCDDSGRLWVPWVKPGVYSLVVNGVPQTVCVVNTGQISDLGEIRLPE